VLDGYKRFSPEATKVKVLTNRVDSDREGQILFNKLNLVVSRYLNLPLTHLGSVPQDSQLSKAVLQQTPVSIQNANAKSARAFEQIAEQLLSGEEAASIKKRGMAAFFSHIVNGKKQG
jgi:flagellar biosynthesis protein FlhG